MVKMPLHLSLIHIYEWAKERIEKHQKVEMQGIISDVYHRDKGCLLILSDIALSLIHI